MLAIAREIGYEERLEAERDAMHALLERTTDLLPDIIYVFDDAERRIVFQNRSIAEDLGYAPERIAEFGDFRSPTCCIPMIFRSCPTCSRARSRPATTR